MTAQIVLAAWAARINAPRDAFERSGTHVTVSPDQRADRVLLYRTPDVTIVVLPAAAAAEAERFAAPHALTARDVIALLPDLRLGPRWRNRIYHVPPDSGAAADHPQIHGLSVEDAPALADLQGACAERERGWAQITSDDPFALGWRQHERLLGVASLQFPGAGIADLSVLVRPQARRRGIGSQLVRQTVRLAVQMDKTVQYIAPEPGSEARALAERLGFVPVLVEECLQTGW